VHLTNDKFLKKANENIKVTKEICLLSFIIEVKERRGYYVF